jgi:hypothetical protein
VFHYDTRETYHTKIENNKKEIKSDPYLPAEASVTTTTAYFMISSADG